MKSPCTATREVAPCLQQLEEGLRSNEDPAQPKIIFFLKGWMGLAQVSGGIGQLLLFLLGHLGETPHNDPGTGQAPAQLQGAPCTQLSVSGAPRVVCPSMALRTLSLGRAASFSLPNWL